MDFKQETLKEAGKSPCNKRKVGAIIVNSKGIIVGRGHNKNSVAGSCEDSLGDTKLSVVHAENMAINYTTYGPDFTMYVTHPPCSNCKSLIKVAGITKVILVEDFMKFDSGKLRYSLIPPIATEALASTLTYGAKKYKPDNWKLAETSERYWDALYRHLQAYRSGEHKDDESGLPHLWHALTNLVFIIFIDGKDSK